MSRSRSSMFRKSVLPPKLSWYVRSSLTPRSRNRRVSTRWRIVAPTCDLMSSPMMGRFLSRNRFCQYGSRAMKTGMQLTNPTLEVLEESLLEFPGALVLVTHDRYLMDRMANERLELWRAAATPPLSERRPGRRTPQKKLTYLEQREYDAMEATLEAAESALAEARRRADD